MEPSEDIQIIFHRRFGLEGSSNRIISSLD